MRAAAAVLAFVASATASSQLLKNYCVENVYITLYGTADDVPTNQTFVLPSEQAYINEIKGEGNTCTVTKNPDVYDVQPKMVLGTSTNSSMLYWSITNETGDPFATESWDLTSTGSVTDVCGNTTTYNGDVHACQDDGVTLTLSFCPSS